MSVRKDRAGRFSEENALSPVVYGSVTGPEANPTGAFYRLENGKTFELTSQECRLVNPRWAIPTAA